MTYPIVDLDWNGAGRAHHEGLAVGDEVVAVDLDASCGWCMAVVTESDGRFVTIKPTGPMNYWPGSDE